ncbi:uncharacterized protein YneF (UPF0154 family) [Wenyingzhuangia heitensis]|uniref:Uncharacterized protein YneF (UPF0154 family) n=1 Tax=Wenyingzhuangia heitensis TaxID=1487859 RepID=A0ABX0U6P0_9FLAO|nr:MFS transporter [Wenyingzhuangia heitensis]NIJ44504.1 uncharacterized protein YneF (UPF0154 family) [Wenyingzhuangia heitensis]
MEQKLKTIKIIHLAIVLGVSVGYYVLGHITSLDQITKLPHITKDSIIYAIIPLAAVIISSVLFRIKLQKIDNSLSFEEKLEPYQAASVMRWAILEGAAFFLIILKPTFITLGIILIVYILLLRPIESKIKRDLKHID